jgi:hypothetical protein
MDYSQLSDQEINAMVGKIVSKDDLSIIASDGNAVIHEYADCGEFKGICLGWKVFDPCHSPADAWPIIVESKIMLSPHCADDEWKAQIHLGRVGIFDNYASAWNKNPLRAAMIVFLMMQDAKHA